MTEVWKDVVGYEGLYQVSNTGKIKSLKLNREVFKNRIVKGRGNKDGYVKCLLSNKGKCEQKYLHKIIAETFIPNPENKPQVDHINCNSLDNRVENLRWCNQKENNNNVLTRLHCSKFSYNNVALSKYCEDNNLNFNSIKYYWDKKSFFVNPNELDNFVKNKNKLKSLSKRLKNIHKKIYQSKIKKDYANQIYKNVTLVEFCKENNINYTRVKDRIRHQNMSVRDAVECPKLPVVRKFICKENGKTYKRIVEAAKDLCIDRIDVFNSLMKGIKSDWNFIFLQACDGE